MATRNILDPLGNIIGTLTLPDSATEDQWQSALLPYSQPPVVPQLKPIVDSFNLIGSGPVTTSSGTPATVGGMTYRPEQGTYIVFFNGSIYTDGASAKGNFGVYVDGVLLAETKRDISCALTLLGGLVTVSLNAIGVGTYTGTRVVLDGTQTIDVRFMSDNGGTIGFKDRVMTLIKVK